MVSIFTVRPWLDRLMSECCAIVHRGRDGGMLEDQMLASVLEGVCRC